MSGTYPPTLDELQLMALDWPYLRQRDDRQFGLALAQAQAEINVAILQMPEPSNPLNAALWTYCLDLAIWRMRWRIERDAETGDMPMTLQRQRTELEKRLTALANRANRAGNQYTVSGFAPIDYTDSAYAPTDGPALPPDGPMF